MFIFKKTFEFQRRSEFDKPHKDQSGVAFTTRESTVEETFIANYGETLAVPEWVKETEHFRMVVADGDAVEATE